MILNNNQVAEILKRNEENLQKNLKNINKAELLNNYEQEDPINQNTDKNLMLKRISFANKQDKNQYIQKQVNQIQ